MCVCVSIIMLPEFQYIMTLCVSLSLCVSLVELLLDLGADVEFKNGSGKTRFGTSSIVQLYYILPFPLCAV